MESFTVSTLCHNQNLEHELKQTLFLPARPCFGLSVWRPCFLSPPSFAPLAFTIISYCAKIELKRLWRHKGDRNVLLGLVWS